MPTALPGGECLPAHVPASRQTAAPNGQALFLPHCFPYPAAWPQTFFNAGANLGNNACKQLSVFRRFVNPLSQRRQSASGKLRKRLKSHGAYARRGMVCQKTSKKEDHAKFLWPQPQKRQKSVAIGDMRPQKTTLFTAEGTTISQKPNSAARQFFSEERFCRFFDSLRHGACARRGNGAV